MGQRSPVDDFGPAVEEKPLTEYGWGNDRNPAGSGMTFLRWRWAACLVSSKGRMCRAVAG